MLRVQVAIVLASVRTFDLAQSRMRTYGREEIPLQYWLQSERRNEKRIRLLCSSPTALPAIEENQSKRVNIRAIEARIFALHCICMPCIIINNSEYFYCVTFLCYLFVAVRPKNTNKSFQQFFQLKDHLGERLKMPMYNVLKSNLITFFKTILSLEDFDELTILKTAAILDTNAFEVRLNNSYTKVRAIYLETAMLSHDCVPNSYHIFDDDLQIYVRAASKYVCVCGFLRCGTKQIKIEMWITFLLCVFSFSISPPPLRWKVDIKKGDILSLSYGQPLQSTIQRRIYLQQSKCFDCTCQRCQDPTELDTFIGSLVCPRCKSGKLLSNNPLDEAANWRCESCSMETTATNVQLIQNRLQFEIENLSKHSPYDLEMFLEKYCCRPQQKQQQQPQNQQNGCCNGDTIDTSNTLLHERNTFVLQIKYALTQLYGRVNGFLWHGKTQFCENKKT